MAKSSGLKRIMLILLPLLLIFIGVLYYRDILAFMGVLEKIDPGVPAQAHPTANRTQSEANAPTNSVEDEESDSADNTSGTGGSSETEILETLIRETTPGNVSEKTAEILKFLPSGLKELRDPFQNLLKQQAEALEKLEQGQLSTVSDEEEAKTGTPPVKPEEVEPVEKVVTYEDLTTTDTAPPVEEVVKPVETPVKPVIQYPPFELKGLVSQEGRQKAILALKGQSYIVSGGERVQDWQIIEITPQGVYIGNQDEQRFWMTLEGVTIDEEFAETQE